MAAWLKPETVTLWIILIAGFVFVLAFSLIGLAYMNVRRIHISKAREADMVLSHQKKLLETSLLTQEKERTRIAADLHDSLIGKLMGLRLRNQLGHLPRETDQMLAETIAEARRISHDLSPPLIEFQALPELIETMLCAWKNTFSIAFSSDIRAADTLTAGAKIHLIRILQELITNTAKHARADALEIRLRHTPKWLVLRMQDNGRGFASGKPPQGLGLYNIALRVQQLHGHYHLYAPPGKGATAVFIFPLTYSETYETGLPGNY